MAAIFLGQPLKTRLVQFAAFVILVQTCALMALYGKKSASPLARVEGTRSEAVVLRSHAFKANRAVAEVRETWRRQARASGGAKPQQELERKVRTKVEDALAARQKLLEAAQVKPAGKLKLPALKRRKVVPTSGPGGKKPGHLDIPLEEVGLEEDEVKELRERNEAERQARSGEIRAQYLKKRDDLSNEKDAWLQTQSVYQEVARASDRALLELHKKELKRHKKSLAAKASKAEVVELGGNAEYEAVQKTQTRLQLKPTSSLEPKDPKRTIRVICSGVARASATWHFLVLRTILQGALREGETLATGHGDLLSISQLAKVLQSSRVALVGATAYHPDLVAKADYVFLSHRDLRNEYASQYKHYIESGSKESVLPELFSAFYHYGAWLPHACYDSKYEDILQDEGEEIKRLATLLCMPEVDPVKISMDIKERLTKAKEEPDAKLRLFADKSSTTRQLLLKSTSLRGDDQVFSYERLWLPGATVDQLDTAFGYWMSRHGYGVDKEGKSSIQSHVNAHELLRADVLRLENCHGAGKPSITKLA